MTVKRTMNNLLRQAINCDDADHAAKLIQDALDIESGDIVNYCFPKEWPPIVAARPAIGSSSYLAS